MNIRKEVRKVNQIVPEYCKFDYLARIIWYKTEFPNMKKSVLIECTIASMRKDGLI